MAIIKECVGNPVISIRFERLKLFIAVGKDLAYRTMDTFCTIVGFALFGKIPAKSVRQGSYCVWRHNTVDFFSVYFAQCVYIRKLLWGNTALRCKLNWKFNLFGSEVNNSGCAVISCWCQRNERDAVFILGRRALILNNCNVQILYMIRMNRTVSILIYLSNWRYALPPLQFQILDVINVNRMISILIYYSLMHNCFISRCGTRWLFSIYDLRFGIIGLIFG